MGHCNIGLVCMILAIKQVVEIVAHEIKNKNGNGIQAGTCVCGDIILF